MSYSEKLENLKKQMAGLSVDLLADIGGKVDDLATLLEDLPDEITLSKVDAKQKDDQKTIKGKWSQVKRDLDRLFGVGGTKKNSGTAGGRKNVTKEEKQKIIKSFVEQSGGAFTRVDVEKHLSEKFERTIAVQFYKGMLDYLVKTSIVTSEPADKNNPKSAITYRLEKGKTIDFSGMK